MPYISTADVKAKRKEIRAAFPDYKFSIRKDGHSGICVSILSGPLDLLAGKDYDNTQVNTYYIDSHYEGEACELLTAVQAIAARGKRTEHMDSDYGAIPTFYANLSIGQWDRPYEVKS